MNLIEMTNQVCSDTGYLDTTDVDYCKTALKVRDDLLYRMGLWKDTLVQVSVAVDPDDADNAEGIVWLPELIERVVAVRYLDGYLRGSTLETFYRVDYNRFLEQGKPVEFAKLSPAWFTWRKTDDSVTPYLVFACESADVGVNMQIVWIDSDGARQITQGALAAAGDASDLFLYSSKITVESAAKPATSETVQVASPWADAIYTMTASQTNSPARQRIRVFPIPTEATTLTVLGKANKAPLTFDYQSPRVTGSHLCLMAFAKHALLKRGGETGPAADALQEAMGLLEVLKREEMQQEAHNQRIMPDSGFGDPFFGPGRDGYFLG